MLYGLKAKQNLRTQRQRQQDMKKPYWKLRGDMAELHRLGAAESQAYREMAHLELQYRVEAQQVLDDIKRAIVRRRDAVDSYLFERRLRRINKDAPKESKDLLEVSDVMRQRRLAEDLNPNVTYAEGKRKSARIRERYLSYRQTKAQEETRKRKLREAGASAYEVDMYGWDLLMQGVVDIDDELDAIENIRANGILETAY